nr:oligosaccharide repeat unit polymerase [uncultured Marinifilum sp.]
MRSDDSLFRAAKYIIIMFSLFVFISFCYAVITKTYNGDFLGFKVSISFGWLVLNLFISVLPFYFLFLIYKRFKNKEIRKSVRFRYPYVEILFYLLFFWQLFLIISFGVGKMTAGVYSAPSFLLPVIQVSNRLSLGFIYSILVFRTDKIRKIILFTTMMIILSLSKFSIGIFLLIGLVLFVKYNSKCFYILKRYKILLIVGLLFSSVLVKSLYIYRNSLRGVSTEYDNTNILTGVLVGRLSSFANSAQIFESPGVFFISAQQLEYFYFQKQALGGFLSGKFLPRDTPESIMINSKHGENIKNVSYMTGTQGNLIFSLFKSPLLLLLNVCSILFLVFLTFRTTRLMGIEQANELALVLLVNPMASGVANEFSSAFFTPIVIWIYLLFVSAFISINKQKTEII